VVINETNTTKITLVDRSDRVMSLRPLALNMTSVDSFRNLFSYVDGNLASCDLPAHCLLRKTESGELGIATGQARTPALPARNPAGAAV
jgi:hypothetical protein